MTSVLAAPQEEGLVVNSGATFNSSLTHPGGTEQWNQDREGTQSTDIRGLEDCQQ